MRCSPTSTLLLLCLLPACGSLDRREEPGGPRTSPPRQELPLPASPAEALATIARLEDAREDGGGLLQTLVTGHGTFGPELRERAALALGRLPLEGHGEGVTRALVEALGDESASVRAAAAFALGLRADPASADGILEHWRDPEPGVRARLIQAASRIDEDRLRASILAAMRHPLAAVREAAVTAPHAWGVDAEVDLALAEVASRLPVGDPRAERMGIPPRSLEEPGVVWRALFTLARRGAEAGRDAFHIHCQDADPLARLFAVQGLAKLEAHDAGRLALEAAMADTDWRVPVEAARGLGAYGDQRSLDALESGLDHPSVHVRVAVVEALSAYPVEPGRIEGLLAGVREDPSAWVRAAALAGEAALRGARAVELLAEALASEDAVRRAGAALAAGRLPTEHAVPLLLPATLDPHPRVAGMAINALGTHDTDEAHARLVELLAHGDNGVRVAAATALAAQPRASDLQALREAFETSHGDVGVDVQVQVLRTLATLEDPQARALVAAAGAHADPWVRRVARELAGAAAETPGPPARPGAPEPELPLPEHHDPGGDRPRVRVRTSRGDMVFDLFPAEAPVHVHSFLSLARAGHYDGLDFHRVVPDFVIQGGCYRGDGNGTGTWRGQADTLRNEFTPRRYVRGSLGMPRSTEVDSGGSQFFVTHRPTPHLDGRYTIFGELREGFEVLDAVEVGDRILGVEVE